MKKKALIFGCGGQDGAYLAELLISKGYEVHGVVRRHSVPQNQSFRLNHILDNIQLHYGDVTDAMNVISLANNIRPDEIYNLAAQSHVRISFEIPSYTFETNTQGFLNVLEAVRIVSPQIKVYQASSSEMFGNNIDDDGFQRITTKMNPVSPYGCAKLAAHNLAANYRNSYGMFIVSGVLFNHESPRRGVNFVTAKVVQGAAKIAKGEATSLALGNLDAARDWGHSKDYVEAMWLMMQQDIPKDYVISTGVSHTVRDLCEYVFSKHGLKYQDYVKLDSSYLRPEELEILKGDSSPARLELGWNPVYTFESLLDNMIEEIQ